MLHSRFEGLIHPDSSVGANKPEGQLQRVAPARETLLPKHGTQVAFEDAPAALLDVPAGQGMGVIEDAGQK